MSCSRALSSAVLALALTACSENFGTAPVDVRDRVDVSAEAFGGPVPTNPLARTLAGTRDLLWLGLERGMYHVQPGPSRWLPAHAGYTPSNQPSIPFAIGAIDVTADGRLSIHAARGGGNDFLFVSSDGGATFAELSVPNPIATQVEVIAALPRSPSFPEGGFLVSQSGAVHVRLVGGEWARAELPSVPSVVRAASGGTSGPVALGVDRADGTPALWTSEDGGRAFAETGLTAQLTSRILDVAVSAQDGIAVATRSELLAGMFSLALAPRTATLAVLDAAGPQVRYAVLLDQEPRLQIGTLVDGDVPVRVEAPGLDVAALLVTGGAVYVATNPGAELWRWDGAVWQPLGFRGGSLTWTALADDPRQPGAVYLGDILGDVHFGEPEGPMSPLRRAQVSIPRALLPDGAGTGVYSGNFGVQLRTGNDPAAPWVDRTQGQASYSLENFFGPVNVQTLAATPDDPGHLWLGSLVNDGPYESLNGGFQWSRVHAGLGDPYSIPDEDGLPAVSQVRAFAFPRGETWMGTYRGGVWSLEEGADRIWRQRNVGLPSLDGAPVDTCCFTPLDVQIDVRDLVWLDEGALLAATGWGVYRDDGAAGRWRTSSNGLTNGDIFALAAHPDRGEWVLAAARGTATNPDWLFLSRDGGRNWNPVDSRLRARFAEDVVWSDPASLEVVAILTGSGAWRMEIAP